MSEEIPKDLTREIADALLTEKENLLTQVYEQLNQLSQQSDVKINLEQTIVMNRTMFDDRMFLKKGYTSQDLQRAIVKYGIYEERMKEAREIEER